MANSRPVTDYLQQIDQSTWILGGRLKVILSPHEPKSGISWSSGEGPFFSVAMLRTEKYRSFQFVLTLLENGTSEAAESSHPVSPVHHGGTIHAVWKLGKPYIKVMIPNGPAITREHTTLQALMNLRRSFAIQKVLFHGEWNGRYVLITRKVRGQAISQA